MNYLFLAYGDEKRWVAMSTNERNAFDKDCLACEDRMRQNGQLLAVEHLPSRNVAMTVRVEDGDV